MPAVFIAQSTLQQWADAGKVRLEDTTLFLLKEQRSVVLKPAVRFTKLTVGDDDPHGLLGKVKTSEQLRAMDAEHYMDSVLCGDIAYEVVEGFLGDLQAAQPIAQPSAPPPADAPALAPPPAQPAAAPQGRQVPAPLTGPVPIPSHDIPLPGKPAPVAASAPKAVPAPVLEATPAPDTDEEPEELSEAEALSKLFLDTVR